MHSFEIHRSALQVFRSSMLRFRLGVILPSVGCQCSCWCVVSNCIRYAHPAEAQTARVDDQHGCSKGRSRIFRFLFLFLTVEQCDVRISLVSTAVENCNVRISLVLEAVENDNVCISLVFTAVKTCNVCISLLLKAVENCTVRIR